MEYKKPRYRFVYLSAFLVSLYYAMTVYINSTYLAHYFDQPTIDHLYMVGALITVFCLIASSRVINRFGNFRLVVVGLFLETAALLTMAFWHNPFAVLIAFITYQAMSPLLIFGFDIFFEGALVTMRDAEKVRSYYLTFMNIAFLCAPFAVGALVARGAFSTIYILAAACVAVLLFLTNDMFYGLKPKRFREIGFGDSFRKFLQRDKLTSIFFMDFLLQSFYAIMVIFTGPYLHNVIGLSWSSIGIVFTIMLAPFVIFEAPLGRMFDRLHDERNVLIAGFFIMAITTILIAYTRSTSLVIWASLLFMSRVGASFVEVATEASFFKRVTDQDAGFIGIFRLATPLGFIIAPFLANVVLATMPLGSVYICLGIILTLGAGIAYRVLL